MAWTAPRTWVAGETVTATLLNAHVRDNLKALTEFVTPTFAAGDFTASGSMTWTVAEADVVTYAYCIAGKRMRVIFTLNTTSVGGTPSNTLKIKVPGGYTVAKTANTPCWIYDNSASVRAIGNAQTSASGTTIDITKGDLSNFTASSDLTYVWGEIEFEVQ